MKKLKLFFALFAMLALGVGNAWAENAPVNTVLWGENFAHFETKTPSDAKTGKGTTIYDGASITYVQSSTKTKAYNEKLAGGTAPELLLSQSNQTWTISGIKTGGATKMTLTFLSNKTTFSVTVSSASLSVSGSQKSWTITLKDGQTVPETFDLTIKNTGSSNARIDNVELKVTVAGTSFATPVDPKVSFSNSTYTVGQTLDLSTLWTSNSDGAVTYSIVEVGTTGASINGKSFTASAAGTCTVKASQAATSAYNAIEETATITVTAPTPATITLFEADQENTVEGKYVGDLYKLPLPLTQTCGTKTFVGWSTVEIATPGDKPTSNFYEPGETVTLADKQTFYAVYATEEGSGSALTQVVDILNRELTGITVGSSTYSDWNGKAVTSSAVYAGNSAGGNNAIQLRSAADKAASGVITTSSGGKATNITIVWESNTQAGRTLNIYGKNTAYNEVADLRDDSKKGTLLGTIVKGTSTSLTIDEDYEYIALCSNSGAMYLTSVSITWTSGGGISYSDYTTSCAGTEEPVASLLSIEANAEDKDEFTVGDAFVKATITATYDDGNTKDVTDDATFTGYDMNTTGTQTVTVTYEDKTTKYDITVNPKPTYTITWNNAGSTTETKVVQGAELGAELGELPTVAVCPNGKKFMGWTATTEVNSDGSDIVYVKENDIPTSDTTYYAVFAVVEGEEGTPTTATVSITDYADAKSWNDKQQYLDITVDANITATATGGDNTGKYYTNGENWRLYQNESATLTISAVASYEIQTVKVTYTVDNTGVLTLDGSNVTSGTAYEVNAASVTFGVGNTGSATNGQVRITAIEVVYASASKKSDFSLDCTINTNPEWTIDVDEIAFADKYVGFEYTETFTISASNLTDDIALAIDGSNFTVSPTSIYKDATFPQTVTVTYAPTAAEDHNATLNITSGSALSKEIALTGSATEATIYTLTALEDIKPTDKVIIVGTSGGNTYAMSNAQGTTAAPTAVAVTVVDDKIATNETNILWNIAKNGDNLTIYPADQTAKWLYCLADENNGVRVGTGNAKEFTIDKGYLYTTQTTYARHIGIYNNADWRCYKPSEDAIANNIKDQSFAFYVLPNTDPSISVTPPRKDFGVLTVSEEATQEFEITALNINEEALTAELTGEGFNKSNIVDNKITITFAPTEVKEYSATLTISAGTEASASVTISGKGAAATYTVTYNSNGATGEAPTDDSKYVADDKVTVAGQGDMTKAGYRFAGWKYDENIYKAGATFRMPAENVTFVAQWVEKEDFSKGYWVLVTDASELNADDYVVIAAAEEDFAMKSYESGNNCGQIGVTKANNLLIWDENVGVFLLAKSGENYTFQDVNTEQYLYAAGTGSNNYLKAADKIPTEAEAAKPYIWTISYTDGVATVKATSDNRNTLMYNTGSDLFACYASGQKDIALYKYVRVPVVELHSGDNSALITVVAGETVNVKLSRSFKANDGYYTICLPFNLDAEKIGKAYKLGDINNHQSGEGGGIDINLTPVTTIEAGVPYLVLPKTLTNPVFENVTINNIDPATKAISTSGAGVKVTFTGIINGSGTTNGTTEYYVGNGGYLYNGTVDKLGLRAFFTITDEAGNPTKVRARVVTREDAATGFENITNGENTTIKVIENGQLVIIRNGEKFNAQGQRL